MATTLSADHIAAAGGGFEPQRKNNFLLRITPPGADAQVIELALSSFPFPKKETESGAINYMNEQRKFPQRTTVPDMELVLRDYVDQGTARVLNSWHERVFNPVTGKMGLCSTIKVQGTLILFAPDGSSYRKWTLIGVWPKAFNAGDGSMDDAGPNEITITLCVDKVLRAA